MKPAGQGVDTPKQALRAMQVLSVVLCAGVTVFAVIIVVVGLISGSPLKDEADTTKKVFIYMAAGLAFACLFFAWKAYRQTAIVKNAVPLLNKLNQYRAVLIKYMALCEGAAIFSIIALFLTGENMLLIITVIMLAAMVSKIPTKNRLIHELALDWSEQEELDK